MLKGLYTALITPFNAKGLLDEEGLRLLLEKQLEGGVQGVVMLGTTGESPTLLPKEKERILSIAVEMLHGKVKVIAGTGSYATAQTVEQTLKAKELGADAALVIVPYYNKPTQEGLFKHFTKVIETGFPIILYNNPVRSGQGLSLQTIQRLSEFQNTIAIKEASGSFGLPDEIIGKVKSQRPEFALLSGNDSLTLPLMAMGGEGAICTLSNLFPKPMSLLVNSCLKGDFKTARQLHYELFPLMQVLSLETNPIPLKAAMSLLGLPSGKCRLPLCELSETNERVLSQVMSKYQSMALTPV